MGTDSNSTATDDANAVLADIDRADDALAGSNLVVDLGPGVFGQQQAGWLVTIETAEGLVQIDTGDQARRHPPRGGVDAVG